MMGMAGWDRKTYLEVQWVVISGGCKSPIWLAVTVTLLITPVTMDYS